MSRQNLYMSRIHVESGETVPDHVDEILQQWNRERPDIDVTGMAIIGRLSRLDKVIRSRLNTVFAQHGLESWEFDVLATLLRSGDPHRLTPGQLLEAMMITSGTMTNRIDRLERRGLVKRMKSPDDGRQILVTLTPTGLDTVDAALIDHAANELAIINTLNPAQRAQLTHLLRTLSRTLETTTELDGVDP